MLVDRYQHQLYFGIQNGFDVDRVTPSSSLNNTHFKIPIHQDINQPRLCEKGFLPQQSTNRVRCSWTWVILLEHQGLAKRCLGSISKLLCTFSSGLYLFWLSNTLRLGMERDTNNYFVYLWPVALTQTKSFPDLFCVPWNSNKLWEAKLLAHLELGEIVTGRAEKSRPVEPEFSAFLGRKFGRGFGLSGCPDQDLGNLEKSGTLGAGCNNSLQTMLTFDESKYFPFLKLNEWTDVGRGWTLEQGRWWSLINLRTLAQ